MSNPVTDPALGAIPPAQCWQDDLANADANLPQPTDTMGRLSSTGLASELRSIKGVVKRFALDPMWVNYTGDTRTSTPSPLPPTASNPPLTFTLTGNWATIAQIGRAVRVTNTNGSQAVGIIVDVSVAGNTAITLDQPIVTAALSYVEFAAIDPSQNPSWLISNAAKAALHPAQLVLDASVGGTNRQDLVLSGDLTGDLTGATTGGNTAATVIGLAGRALAMPVLPTNPADGAVLAWDQANSFFAPALHFITTMAGFPTNGTLAFVVGSEQWVLAWGQSGDFTTAGVGGNINVDLDPRVNTMTSWLVILAMAGHPSVTCGCVSVGFPANIGTPVSILYTAPAGITTRVNVLIFGK